MNHAFTQAKLFKVVRGAEDRPVYEGPDVWTPDSKETIERFIEKAKSIATQPYTDQDERNAPPSRHKGDFAGAGRDVGLDIREEHKSGVCLYIFVLSVPYFGRDRLLFVDSGDRFCTLPLNSTTNEDFIKEVKHFGINPRIAAFEVDLDALHKSALADRIRKSAHNNAMFIPFYFNVIDPDPSINAAPWVHSGHGAHHHGHSEESGSGHSHRHGRRTHGGVHPDTMALFGAEL